ncbi:MAG: glycerol kinase GlpK [Acidimicrobiales bacterium]|nr:glycerol kinase GlpK [Acidimicrobiales bacterium]RZV47134.1 MAG: glycerol kinase [Acidimicrobiales bacterium]
MSVVVAIDAGTTGVRSIAFTETGKPVGSSYREFPQYFPQPGWVEHDATEIWEAVLTTLGELASMLDEPIAAIGITDQRETVVVWDKATDQPIHRAIVWQDRRTAAQCEAWTEAGHLDMVRSTTGLVLDPYFSGSKLHWLIDGDHITVGPNTAFGTVDSWLVWKLTGGKAHITDPSNASRTLLYDIGQLAWSEEMLDLMGVPASMLPEVRGSSERYGTTTPGLPIPAGIPISGIAGDQQAALFGQACFAPGSAKNTYGTGSFILMNVGQTMPEPVEGLLTTVGWTLADGSTTYAMEGAVFVTGAAIQWLRDGLGIIDEASEIGPLAASVDSSDDVFLVPAFTGLGSPWWDPYARGTIVGITRGTTKAHIARATVESMALQSRDVIDAMASAGGVSVESLRVDGGASVMELLLQIQADQIGVPVHRSAITETTALGAAYLAGIAEGVWSGTDEVSAAWQSDLVVEPTGDRSDADALHARWLEAVQRSRGWAG